MSLPYTLPEGAPPRPSTQDNAVAYALAQEYAVLFAEWASTSYSTQEDEEAASFDHNEVVNVLDEALRAGHSDELSLAVKLAVRLGILDFVDSDLIVSLRSMRNRMTRLRDAMDQEWMLKHGIRVPVEEGQQVWYETLDKAIRTATVVAVDHLTARLSIEMKKGLTGERIGTKIGVEQVHRYQPRTDPEAPPPLHDPTFA